MVNGRVYGHDKLSELSRSLRNDFLATLDRIGQKAPHIIEAAVVANFERKRPEWPGYKSASWLAHRERMGRERMLVFHGELKGAIESGYKTWIGQRVVWCGVPNLRGAHIARIARAHEFGTATIPERSFLRTGAEDARPEFQTLIKKEFKKTAAKWSAGR